MIHRPIFVTSLILGLCASSAFAETPTKSESIRPDRFFKMTQGGQSDETILLSSSKQEGEQAYFMSYSINGRAIRMVATDREYQDEVIETFERALPPQRQKKLESLGPCGVKFELIYRKTTDGEVVSRRMCMDAATKLEREALAKIWLDIRGLLRI